jgi:hypothetical protein
MLVAGLGKEAKIVTSLGSRYCPNCHNTSYFTLVESANKLALYFVPVLRFNKQHSAICGTCGGEWVVDEDSLTRLMTPEGKKEYGFSE